jgi:hypothetical protein
MIILLAEQGRKSPQILGGGTGEHTFHPWSSLLRFGVALRMKALVVLAQWPTGLTPRENVLNLRFTARKITIGGLL